MGSARLLLMVLLVLAMVAPNLTWPASETTGPAAGPSVGGRGEGFEPPAEAAKGEEIPPTFGPIITDTAIPIEKGKFALQPIFGYSFINGVFNESWKRASARGNFQTFFANWQLTYGPMENMEVFVIIPYARNWARKVIQPGPNGETSGSSGGLADIDLTLKYRLVQETDCLPTVTALFATDFATGKFKNLNPTALGTDVLGGGAYVFTPGINLSKYINPVIVYANLWYSMQTSFTDDGGKQYPGDFVTVNLAAEYPITKKWVALLELTSSWGGGRLFGPEVNTPRKSLASIIPGIEYMATDKFSLALGLNVDLVGRNSDAAITPLFSMIYAF